MEFKINRFSTEWSLLWLIKAYRILLLAILISFPGFLHAQNSEIKFRNPKLQLSDNNVHVIFQDFKGFMWFGTESGLNRYDGINMNVYEKEYSNSNSLSLLINRRRLL